MEDSLQSSQKAVKNLSDELDSLLDNLDQVVSSSSSLIDNQDLIQATVTSQKIDLGSPDAVETFVNIKNVADKILLMDDDSEVARKVWPETSSEYLRQAEEKIRELDSATDTVLKAMAHLRVAIMGDKCKHGTLESTKSERSETDVSTFDNAVTSSPLEKK